MINYNKNKISRNVITGSVAGGTLGYILGGKTGSVIGLGLGAGLGFVKDRNPNGLLTKSQVEKSKMTSKDI